MMNFEVTIVIPAYNAQGCISRAIDSVKKQSLSGWKIILIDDGSKDKTVEAARRCADGDVRITIIEKENGGVSSARNCAIGLLQTEWVLFLDADDELPPDALKNYQKAYSKNPNLDFIAGGIEKISKKRTCYTFKPLRICTDKSQNYALNVINETSYGTVWGKLFKTNLIKSNHLRFNENLSHAEDCLFVYEYLRYSRCPGNTDKMIYRYYVNDSSATKKFNQKVPGAYIDALNELKRQINTDNPYEMQSFYNCCLLHLLLITVNYAFHKDNPASLRQKIYDYQQLLENPLFKEALQKAKMENMKRSNQCVVRLIRLHCYIGVYLCAMIRQEVR